MNFKKNVLTVAISAGVLAVSGCGITPQDTGLGNSVTPMNGVAVDGYLAQAVIYVDVNENNRLDPWEKRALTDSRGYFSYRPELPNSQDPTITDSAINYCELPATDKKSVHCLNAPTGLDEVMVRMTKGYDLATVEPFTGTLSMKVVVSSSTIDTLMVATPITGLLSEMTETEKATFLSNAGITDTSDIDFLDYANSLTATERRVLLNLALKTHKVADVTAALLDIEFDQGTLAGGAADGGFFGVGEGIPTDASVYVYRAIVSELNAGNTLMSIMSDVDKLTVVVNGAFANMKSVITEANDRLSKNDDESFVNPSDALLEPVIGSVDVSGIATKVLKVAEVVETVFSSTVVLDSAEMQNDVISRIRAIDVVVALTRAGEAAAAITKAFDLASDAAYLTNLRDPGADMASLKKKIIASPGAITAADADFSGRKGFSELLGADTAFTGSNSEGFGGNSLDLTESGNGVEVDFGGSGTDTSGSLTIDASFLDGDFATTKDKVDENGNPVLDANGDPVPEPLALEGTWEKLDDYTMLMNIEVAGIIEPVIVKPNEDGTGYYFDLGGEQVVWSAPPAP